MENVLWTGKPFLRKTSREWKCKWNDWATLPPVWNHYQTDNIQRLLFWGPCRDIRPVSGTTVPFWSRRALDNYIMFDCGEGTLLQLCRKFGYTKAMHVLRNLNAIYISHLHSDHQLGFIGLVKQRELAFAESAPNSNCHTVPPLYVLAPPPHADFIMMYHAKYEPILQHLVQVRNDDLFTLRSLNGLKQRIEPGLLGRLREDCGLEAVTTCKSHHCKHAYNVAVTLEDGYKLIYTGDLRPSEELIGMSRLDGRSPDLVIHEATVEHYMLAEAVRNKHCTISEAIEETGRMGAGFTILTHFLQLYRQMPALYEVPEHRTDVGFAWDFMTVCPATFHLLPAMRPALEHVFKREFDILRKTKRDYLKRVKKSFTPQDEIQNHISVPDLEGQKKVVPYSKRSIFRSLEDEI